MSTQELLRQQVLEALRDDGDVSATPDRERVAVVVKEVVERFQLHADQGLHRPLANPSGTIERLVQSVLDAGVWTKFFADPTRADELMVNGDTTTYSTREGRMEVDPDPSTEEENLAVVERLFADAGTAVNTENPVEVHQVWGNQVRASVSIPPVADGLDAAFRIYRPQRTTLPDLARLGSFTAAAANLLAAAMLALTGVLVSGAPKAGKTTILSSLLLALPPTTNLRIIQEARELHAPHLPGGRWSPGAGYDFRGLVNRAMQFGPDCICLSETRGAEAFEIVKAANAGCGFLTTLHARSARMAMESLVTAALMAGENVPERAIRRSFASLIDVVVHCAAQPLHLVKPGTPRLRQVMEISTVPHQLNDDQFTLEPVFKRERLGAPLEFMGKGSLGELEAILDGVLPDGITAEGLCTGQERLL